MLVTVLGIVIEVKPEHENVKASILVTELGMVIEVKPMQL